MTQRTKGAATKRIAAGYARRDITPPVGTWMMGYAARNKPCEGVHDPIYASALAVSDGGKSVLLLALDLCMVDAEAVVSIKEAIFKATRIGPEDVLINTSHTHSGPTTHRETRVSGSEDYVSGLIEKSAEAAAGALRELKPARLSVGSAPLDIGCNRREETPGGEIILGVNPTGPRLAEVTVWNFSRQDAGDLLVFSTPIHGATLGPDNYLISGDWSGAAVRRIEQKLPGVRALFLQGCCGDQNPYRQGGTFELVEGHGEKTAAAVAQALKNMTPATPLPVKTVLREAPLPLEDDTTFGCWVHGLRLGDAMLVGISAEVFVEYALFGRKKSPAKSTLILGCTNGCVSYIPVASAYEKGGYETVAYKYFALGKSWKPSVEIALKDAIANMLTELSEAS